jgi:dihydrofolate reductase
MLERQQSTAARVSGRYLRPILTVISNFFRPPDTWLPEDAHQAVAELKDRPGKEILMFGSWTLWNDLLVAGLVDELHLMVGATVLGGGTPAFDAAPVPPLRLASARRRDGSDNLLLRYEVVGRDE